MALTNNLRRRLNYLENTSTSNSWAKDSTTDYSGVVVSYIVKVIGMLILLCVDIGFNSSVDHDDPMPIGGSDSLRLTFGMIYFGSQIVVQILVFVMFFLLLCGTYLFRVGLIGVLSKYFKWVMFVTLTYLILTCALGAMRLAHIGAESGSFAGVWNVSGYSFVSIVQKLFATYYYVINIRTAIQLGQPKFYTKEPWVQMYREGNK